MEPTKKWYKSKIVVFAMSLVVVAGSNLGFNWLSGTVTPEQLAAIETGYPQAVEIIERIKNGENILSLLGVIVGLIITISRVWFTTTLLPQSIKKK